MSFLSTAGGDSRWTFLEALLLNMPGDGGLFLPADLEELPHLDAVLNLPWHPRNGHLLHHLTRTFDAPFWEGLSREALDFPPHLVELQPGLAALELFHGPSLSFKDYGINLLAATLSKVERRPRIVLCATSGDTGAAVAQAFGNRDGFRAAVLYPESGVSPFQERQIACAGPNVSAFAVKGDFDACQAMVKATFADPQLSAEVGLVSANSINPLRLLAQVLYYAEAWARFRGRVERLTLAVPCGNFGNLCAGLLARRLGLPLDLIAATNANRTVPRFLEGGSWDPRPAVRTLSNAMDISAPNNWARVVHLCRPRRDMRWGSLDDNGTLTELRALKALGYQGDPHGAVASGVLRRVRRGGEQGVFLATAHPAKFAESLEPHLGWRLPAPKQVTDLAHLPLRRVSLPADPAALREALRASSGAFA